MEPKTITGEKIRLRPLQSDEIEQLRLWRNVPENQRLFFTNTEISPEEYLRRHEKFMNDELSGTFAIVLKGTDELLGNINYRIDRDAACATVGIMIGDTAHRGRGYGTEATELLARDLAARFGVKETLMEVLSINESAIRFYEKNGYATVRTVKDRHTLDGKPCDVLIMSKKIQPE